MKRQIELSIIILQYNTKDLLANCLNSLKTVKNELSFEVIVVDNGSTDGSIEAVKNKFGWVKLVENGENLGFAAGNNRAKPYARGKYILFLNSDTLMEKGTLKATVEYLKANKDAGALTCKLVLANGELDKDARRSFPTPWVSFTHLVLHLDKMFPTSPLFSKYWYGYISPEKTHEVDAIQGAYLLAEKGLLDKLGWFDEDYYLDGEDIDLCWRIKELGLKIIYYPKVSIIHLKGASKGKKEAKKRVSLAARLKFRMAGVNSMEIFYKKRLWKHYPLMLNVIVLAGIKFLKLVRFAKTVLS